MSDFIRIAECDTKSLKCFTLEEIFELFFNSERVVEDLNKEINSSSPSFSLNFRLWDGILTYQMEFRGFVYKDKFCALTQIIPKMKSMNPLPDGSYVIDFGVIFKSKTDIEVIVIEINPFAKEAGASLFNWKDDIEVLTGKKEFEFRLVENENEYNYSFLKTREIKQDKKKGQRILKEKTLIISISIWYIVEYKNI